MGWWSWEYLPSLWDSGDEATGPQIVETITVGGSPEARTPRGRRQSVRLRPITRRHLLVTHTADLAWAADGVAGVILCAETDALEGQNAHIRHMLATTGTA
jgi:hypothetical protein